VTNVDDEAVPEADRICEEAVGSPGAHKMRNIQDFI